MSPDRTRPPAAGPRRPFRFPDFVSHRLTNGLEVRVMRRDAVPVAQIEVLLSAGGQQNPLDRPGLAALHGAVIDEGTVCDGSLELAARAERLGGSLSAGAGWNVGYVEVGLLAQHAPEALALLSEVVLEPSFPDSEIDRLRERQLTELMRLRAQPARLAEEAFSYAIYRGTPYAVSGQGTEDSLAAIDREALIDFHRRHVVPRGAGIIVVGDVDVEATIQRVEALFGSWADVDLAPAPNLAPEPLPERIVLIVDRPEAAQTQLLMGHAAIPRRHPDFEALFLASSIFGGKFTSRINLNLRERHGFTYGASSVLVRRRGPGPFFVRTAVANDVAGRAVEEVLLELDRLRSEPVADDELQDAQDYLLGSFPSTLQGVGELAQRMEELAVFDLPDDHYATYPAVFADLNAGQLLDAAQRHLQPDHLAIVAVGPADLLEPQLSAYGRLQIQRAAPLGD
ncbi:MAG: pitrilysin family protein [Acidobacteriota bacterium]